jgi:FKBP-type peptidyl-prolyl cis-trans isomerase
LGKGKAIKAMELAVASMVGGERAKITARSDYCYGKDGLRRSNGDVMVPPFATLEFDITLLEE